MEQRPFDVEQAMQLLPESREGKKFLAAAQLNTQEIPKPPTTEPQTTTTSTAEEAMVVVGEEAKTK